MSGFRIFFRKAVALVGLLGFLVITIGFGATILGLFNPSEWIPDPRILVILLASLSALTLSCCLNNCAMVFRYGGMLVKVPVDTPSTSDEEDAKSDKHSAILWTMSLLSRAFRDPVVWAVIVAVVVAYPGFRFVRYAWNSGAAEQPYAAGIWLPEKYEIIEVDMAEADVIAKERLGNVTIFSRSFDEYKHWYSQSQHLICWSRDGQVAYFTKEQGYISKIRGKPVKLRETGVQYLSLDTVPAFRPVTMTEMRPGVFKVNEGRAFVWSISMSFFATIATLVISFIIWGLIGEIVDKS